MSADILRHPSVPEMGAEFTREAARTRVVDWLSGHARILSFWRDTLVADGADRDLIDSVDAQADWLNATLYRLCREG